MMLFLGPMAGFTDFSFRNICAQKGCTNTITEMVSAIGLLNAPKGSMAYMQLLKTGGHEKQCSAQIFGSNPDICVSAGKLIEDMACFNYIDINMGCPVKKIVGNGEGSALMKNIPLAAKIVETMKKHLSLPISVKCRLGWDSYHINILEFAKAMENAGANMISIHARTREQFYQGEANWDYIAKVKQSLKIPVIANGDIKKPEDAKSIIKKCNCDGIMVARASLGNPWIFSQINAVLKGEEYSLPNLEEKRDMALLHLYSIAEQKGEQQAVNEAKSQIGHYFFGLDSAAIARRELNSAKDIKTMQSIISTVFNKSVY